MELLDKLTILAHAAKYDASCASSDTDKRHSAGEKQGLGSTEGMGICHAYAPDGRCISLLKILLTNSCVYDCLYCINRHSSNVRRARRQLLRAEAVSDLAIDPKLAWALEHREDFSMDVNRASREKLLRVPGFGVRSVDRIIRARRHRGLRMADLARLRLPIAKIAPFVVALDHRPRTLDRADLASRLAPPPRQADLFG